MDKRINIIAFNIPYPPNYGGIIDIYNKVRVLHELGVKVYLHCFEYERPKAKELDAICEKVYYYKRKTGLIANFSLLPYNVNSRKDPQLLSNLLENDYPILFEGLHTCYFLSHPKLKSRIKFFRAANIEHEYYKHLAHSTGNLIKKLFYHIESFRLERYQPVARHADTILTVSKADKKYFAKKFPDCMTEFIPCFHSNDQIKSKPGESNFVLYHGKLSVEENELAAIFLAEQVFSKLECKCVIAGMDPSDRLKRIVNKYPNIALDINPSEERMQWLVQEAHIHILITFQDTGLKLKLLNSLFAGRHIIVNDMMLKGSGLDSLCHIANSSQNMIETCFSLMKTPFSIQEIHKRQSKLYPQYSNNYQGKHIANLIDYTPLLRRERMPART